MNAIALNLVKTIRQLKDSSQTRNSLDLLVHPSLKTMPFTKWSRDSRHLIKQQQTYFKSNYTFIPLPMPLKTETCCVFISTILRAKVKLNQKPVTPSPYKLWLTLYCQNTILRI